MENYDLLQQWFPKKNQTHFVWPLFHRRVSNQFAFDFENSGFMVNGSIFTIKAKAHGCAPTLLGDILEKSKAPDKYFIPEDKLYYTDPAVNHSDETAEELPKESRQTWQYIKRLSMTFSVTSTTFIFWHPTTPIL